MGLKSFVLNIEELDGIPSVFPYKLKVPNTSLDDNGDGTATLDFAAGIGGAFTSGSILFSDGTTVAEDNANLFWDDTANELKALNLTGTGLLNWDGAVTINSSQADKNFAVGTLDSANTLFVDGEKGTVGIGAQHPYFDKNNWKGTLYIRGSRNIDSYRGLVMGQNSNSGAGIFNYVEALDAMFFGFTLWVNDPTSKSELWYGGIGWGGHDVQRHKFYTNPTYKNGSVGSVLRYEIDEDGYVYFPGDDQYVYFGAGNDARIYYNNTNFIIDPDVVGSGKVLIGVTGNDTINAGAYEVGGVAGANFNGAITNLTVVNGIVTAAS